MSELNLNLLPSQAKFQAAKIRYRRKITLIVAFMVGVWLVVVAVMIGVGFFTNWRVDQAQKSFSQSEKNYLALTDNIVTSQRLKYRAKLVGGALKSRFEYNLTFEAMSKLFPADISIIDFELKDKGLFAITGNFSGRNSAEEFENKITSINAKNDETFDSAELNSLSMVNGVWNFDMGVKMK